MPTMTQPRRGFTYQQIEQLLAPINPTRVLGLKKGSATLSYVAQHDVRAHLTRMFGFGNWSMDVLESHFMWEDQNTETKRWTACYRATVRLTICSFDGEPLCSYTDCHASGNLPQPDRAEAHALALTTAVSTAMKRAATCLGDQFGLSLYNKGQRTAFVLGTLVGTPGEPAALAAEVKAMGDESDQDIQATPEPEVTIDMATGEMTERQVADAVGGVIDSAMSTTDEGQILAEAWLTELRSYATTSDASARILAVAALKQKAAGTDILSRTLNLHGNDMTYARLADLVAGGQFLTPETTP